MLLYAETTISTIVTYVTSLPEPVELLVFGAAIASVAFVLRSVPAKTLRAEEEGDAAK